MNELRRVAFVGAGAVGLLYASRLARAGVEVHILFRSDFETARQSGISVHSHDGDFELTPDQFIAHQRPATVPETDLVVITAKTTSNGDLPPVLKPLVHRGTRLLTLQNGLGNEAFLAHHFPEARIFGGTAFICVHRTAPAQISHTHGGNLHIGRHLPGPPSPDYRADEETHAIGTLLRKTGVRVDVFDSLARARWEKQLWNVPFNGLGAAMLADTAILLANPVGRQLVRKVMSELLEVAAADGHPFSPGLADRKIETTLAMGSYRTSMQLDREAGRPLEIGSIIASVTQLAQKHRIATPTLDLLLTQLQAIDTNWLTENSR